MAYIVSDYVSGLVSHVSYGYAGGWKYWEIKADSATRHWSWVNFLSWLFPFVIERYAYYQLFGLSLLVYEIIFLFSLRGNLFDKSRAWAYFVHFQKNSCFGWLLEGSTMSGVAWCVVPTAGWDGGGLLFILHNCQEIMLLGGVDMVAGDIRLASDIWILNEPLKHAGLGQAWERTQRLELGCNGLSIEGDSLVCKLDVGHMSCLFCFKIWL